MGPEERKAMQAERDARTVFVTGIHPRATIREIWELFSQAAVVVDIHAIDDARTRTFKGLAYVELERVDMVPVALALNGLPIRNYPIAVHLSQADRIRMGAELQSSSSSVASSALAQGRLKVSSLPSKIQEEDLAVLFSVFGECSISLDRESKQAVVTYQNYQDALDANREMQGMKVLERTMKIQLMEQSMSGVASFGASSKDYVDSSVGFGELDDDANGGLRLTAQSRIALMQRLQRNSKATDVSSRDVHAQQSKMQKFVQRSTCIVLKNLFDPDEEYERSGRNPNFDMEIRDDVSSEASRFGHLEHIFVDRESKGGIVFLRFRTVQEAQHAVEALNGRWFANKQITADYVPEATYNLRFPESVRKD